MKVAGVTDYLRNALLDEVFSATNYTAGSIYACLMKLAGAVTHTGSTWAGTTYEPDSVATEYVGYLRATATNNATFWPAASSGSKSLASTGLAFPTSTSGASVTVTYFGIADNTRVAGGNALVFGTLTTPQSVAVGDTPSFASGSITVTLA